jgi:hypothetical protein
MVQDIAGEDTRFDPGDKILFSIRQVPSLTAGGPGYQATGSEIFWMDGASTVAAPVGGYLFHGGHRWDKAYALANLRTQIAVGGEMLDAVLDLNALEAIGVPEPSAIALCLLAGMIGMTARGRRRWLD